MAELVSRSLDGALSAVERVGLLVHLLHCAPCRRFRRQARRLDAACRAAHAPPPGGGGLSDAARGRIAAALGRAAGD